MSIIGQRLSTIKLNELLLDWIIQYVNHVRTITYIHVCADNVWGKMSYEENWMSRLFLISLNRWLVLRNDDVIASWYRRFAGCAEPLRSLKVHRTDLIEMIIRRSIGERQMFHIPGQWTPYRHSQGRWWITRKTVVQANHSSPLGAGDMRLDCCSRRTRGYCGRSCDQRTVPGSADIAGWLPERIAAGRSLQSQLSMLDWSICSLPTAANDCRRPADGWCFITCLLHFGWMMWNRRIVISLTSAHWFVRHESHPVFNRGRIWRPSPGWGP